MHLQRPQIYRNSHGNELEVCQAGIFHPDDLNDNVDPEIRARGLCKAAQDGHLEIVRQLLDLDPSIKVNYYTASAGVFGGLPVYRFLHSRYPDMIHWSFDISGCAVYTACRLGNMEVLRYLLEHGADPGREPDPTYVAFYIHPPMDIAVWNDNEDALRLLVQYGATFKGREALKDAALFGRMKAARCLIDMGFDVNYICAFDVPHLDICRHCTAPLHAAAGRGHIDMVQSLLANGADPRLRDPLGKTAIDVAREAVFPEVFKLLER